MSGDWKQRPTLIQNWPEDVGSVMAIDENGITDLEYFKKQSPIELFKARIGASDRYDNEKWFTTTGVVMSRHDYPTFADGITTIKKAYWTDGKATYKGKTRRVVFHSREIRKKEGPFEPSQMNYGAFISDLSALIERTPFIVFSSSIDKVSHVEKYTNPHHVYNLCLNFIVERYCRLLNETNQKGLLLLESRGKSEDHKILDFLVSLIENGNNFNSGEHFKNITGVYFNPKWSIQDNYQMSFPILELADLVSFPIFKHLRSKNRDQAFDVVERKLHGFPYYYGYGLKKFP